MARERKQARINAPASMQRAARATGTRPGVMPQRRQPRQAADATALIGTAAPRLAVPHPLECVRRRPRGQTKYREPWSRDRRHADGHGSAVQNVIFTYAPEGGQKRINFTYRNSHVTTAGHSYKTNRPVFADGVAEDAYHKFLECDPDTLDYVLQSCTATIERADGTVESYTFDGERTNVQGQRIFFEVKPDGSYFLDPQLTAKLDAVTGWLNAEGHLFERVLGRDHQDNLRASVVQEIFAARTLAPRPEHLRIAAGVIVKGDAEVGDLWLALGAQRQTARRISYAMLVRRQILMPIDRPITAATRFRQIGRAHV